MPFDDAADDRPSLVLPYWTSPIPSSATPDTGQLRPLPGAPEVVWWLCPSVRPLTPYAPGQDLTVEVDVGNWGGANAASLANVTVWWTPPSTAFSKLTVDNLLGVDLVPVPPRGSTRTTRRMTRPIPPTAPPHVCLLVRVFHALDPLPVQTVNGTPVVIPDPVGDRHWAQRNLTALTAQPGTPVSLLFDAVNPTPHPQPFELGVHPADERVLEHLATLVDARPLPLRARFRLTATDHGTPVVEPGETVRYELSLREGERRGMHLEIDLESPLDEDAFAAFEIVQRLDGRPVGGLGVIVRG